MKNDIEPDPARPACRQFETELAAYLEGETRPVVPQHALECPFCAAILAGLELMRSACRALALKDEEPPARLWANLRAALVAEGLIREPATKRGRWIPDFAWARLGAPASALACLALLSVFLMVPSKAIDPTQNAGWLALGDRTKAASDVYALEDSQLAQTVDELQKSFEARQTSLAPEVKATYRRGLESLDASIRECRASVEREPADTLARQYLVTAYTQKAEVLATALQFDVR